MWVGLDTNAAAGRNGTKTAKEGPVDVETYVIHDSMAGIVARHRQEANCLRGVCPLSFVLRSLGFISFSPGFSPVWVRASERGTVLTVFWGNVILRIIVKPQGSKEPREKPLKRLRDL